MRAISLFSGAGGFEIGFDRAGIETVLQCEINPIAQSVLRRHWPDTERISDVRGVGHRHGADHVEGEPQPTSAGSADAQRVGAGVRGADGANGGEWDRRGGGHGAHAGRGFRAGDIDLVYGGFPCQDLSVAGKRAGLGGERSGLWFEFHRVLRELRPRWAVIENVVGLLSSNQGRDFGVVLEGLEELGFGGISWAVLDAQNFGVPQRRRRVFVVAGPSRRACEQVLSLCESCGGNPETGGTPGQDVAPSLSVGTLRVGGATAGNNPGITNAVIANPLGAHHHRHDLDNETYVAASLRASDGHHGHSSPRGDGADNLITAPTLSAQDYAKRYNNQWVDTGQAVLVGTITSNWYKGAGNTQVEMGMQPTPAGVRRLTPLECERLMGWPDGWTKYDDAGRELADSHRYRLCGNGVVATVAEWIGRRLMEVDRNDNLR